jgi:outer membrane immunogenic protein
MRKFVGIVWAAASVAVASVSGAVSGAVAADMPVKAPVYKAAPPSWTGFYFGVGAGFRADDSNARLTSATQSGPGFTDDLLACLVNIACSNGVRTSATSFRVSPYVGYNWQFSPLWVAGIEADWGWAGKTTTFGGMTFPATAFVNGPAFAADTFAVRTTWDASLRGRVGYLVDPRVLLYGTAGVAWQHVEEISNCGPFTCAPGGIGPAFISQSANKAGPTVGAGIEALFWGNWIARAEYRYADFGHASFADVRTCPAAFCGIDIRQSTVTDVSMKSHIATFGLAYKLGDPVKPPVSAYASMGPPPAIPAWTGAYLGAGVGVRGTDASVNLLSAVFNPVGLPPINETAFLCGGGGLCPTGAPFASVAFHGDVFAGYNFQVAPRWVLGAEGDLGLADRTTRYAFGYYPGGAFVTGRDGSSFDLRTTWDASIRARLGYLAMPSMLVYLTAGPAWQHIETSSNCSTIASGGLFAACAPGGGLTRLTPPVLAHSDTRLGWTVGAGAEYLLSSNWSLRGEYRYADYGRASFTDVRTCATCALFVVGSGNETVMYDVHLRTHTATFGVAYKFGEPTVTAKY